MTTPPTTEILLAPPISRRDLYYQIRDVCGVRVAHKRVCRGHVSPLDWLWALERDEPDLSLCHASRGSGKSFLQGVRTHLRSLRTPGHATKILGGSKQQAAQIYDSLKRVAFDAPEAARGLPGVASLLTERARYRNGSTVQMLAASNTSVRGPHVPDLDLDEIDEIDRGILDAAMGMAQDDVRRGIRSTIVMSSTWHNSGGVMGGYVERAEAGELPLYRFCVFDVLERCPEERSGPHLENCPECPIVRWCHEDRDEHPEGLPKAKRADGHYSIRSFIQKVRGVSPDGVRSDFLCQGPRLESLIFPEYSEANVSARDAEYRDDLPVHVSIDTDVHTGVVFCQPEWAADRDGRTLTLRVFDESFAVDRKPDLLGSDLRDVLGRYGRSPRSCEWSADPAGKSRTGTGVYITGTIEATLGIQIRSWPHMMVKDSLAQLRGLVLSGDGRRRLIVHPRCRMTDKALRSFRRAEKNNVLLDEPVADQHPHEDMVDALRGALRTIVPPPAHRTARGPAVHASRIL
jgi:hypothetical protein